MNPKLYLKAIVAAVLAGLGVAYIAFNDGTISPQEWVQMAEAAVVAGSGAYAIPNQAPSQTQEGRHATDAPADQTPAQ